VAVILEAARITSGISIIAISITGAVGCASVSE
jgi:hypothetical protein